MTHYLLIIFEAKNENIKGGFAQCIAAMIAAQRFNAQEKNTITVGFLATFGESYLPSSTRR